MSTHNTRGNTGKISELQPEKACGADLVTGDMLREFRNELSTLLLILINFTFQTASIPKVLKLA